MKFGAGEAIRTPDPNLGKVVLCAFAQTFSAFTSFLCTRRPCRHLGGNPDLDLIGNKSDSAILRTTQLDWLREAVLPCHAHDVLGMDANNLGCFLL